MSRATRSCGGIGQGVMEGVICGPLAAATGQQPVFRSGQVFRPGLRAQGQKAHYDAPDFGIDRDEAFGVQLAEGNVERPLIGSNLPQTVRRQVDAFADADAGEASEQKGVRKQVVGTAQFLLQSLIIFNGKRFWQIVVPRREILAANQVGLDVVAVGRQIVQQTTDEDQILSTGFVAQGWILLAQVTEPAQQMRITAELFEAAEPWEPIMKIAEKPANRYAVGLHRGEPTGHGEGVDVRFEDLVEASFGLGHGIGGVDKRVRFSVARAYSRQTSWGARWTYNMVV